MYPPGTRLGSYEIVSELGAGGMGMVFRARHAVLGHGDLEESTAEFLVGDVTKRFHNGLTFSRPRPSAWQRGRIGYRPRPTGADMAHRPSPIGGS